MADITILNLNMLYVRYYDSVERELHLPLGPLYVTAALEQAGGNVSQAARDAKVDRRHLQRLMARYDIKKR